MESRTQGSRPRPRTQKKSEVKTKDKPFREQNLSRPTTAMLEAKDTGASVLKKKKKKVFKNFFQAISNVLAYPEFLVGGGLNHRSDEMTSSKFFQTRSFCGTEISWNGRSEIVVACLHVTRIFQRKRA